MPDLKAVVVRPILPGNGRSPFQFSWGTGAVITKHCRNIDAMGSKLPSSAKGNGHLTKLGFGPSEGMSTMSRVGAAHPLLWE